MRGQRLVSAAALALALAAVAAGPAQAANGDGSADRARAAEGGVVSGVEYVTLSNANVDNFQRREACCPAGKKVIGGGAEARGETAVLVGSFPNEDNTGWIGLGRQTDASDVGISVFAICANVD